MQRNFNDPQTFEREGLGDIFGIQLNAISGQHLRTIANWAIICGITGFLGMAIIMISLYKTFTLIITYGLTGDSFFVLVGGLIFIVLNLLLNIFLLRIGILFKKTLANQSQAQLGQALLALRNYVRSLGAYLIVFIFLVLFVFVVTYISMR